MNRAAALRVVFDFCRENGGVEVRAAVAVLEVQGGAKAPKISERGRAFADWFRTTLAEDSRLAARWRDEWARCFDAMVKLDGRTPAQIADVCRWARAHDFWRMNFLTPLKLRQRKDGVMYFDRFAEAMKGACARPAKRVQPAGYKNAPSAGPVAVSASELLQGGGK